MFFLLVIFLPFQPVKCSLLPFAIFVTDTCVMDPTISIGCRILASAAVCGSSTADAAVGERRPSTKNAVPIRSVVVRIVSPI